MRESKAVRIEKECVYKNISTFYGIHKDECERKYQEATGIHDFYMEEADLNAINCLLLKSSIVILTANVFERNILHLNAFNASDKKIVHSIINSSGNPERSLSINVYFFEIDGQHILHMEANQTGSYSMGGSADLIRYIMNNDFCFPTAIISYGICFGRDCIDQRIGDTIIARKLYPYFMSAKVKEKVFFVRDTNTFEVDPKLDVKLRHLIGQGYLSESDRIYYDNMVTGEAVISNNIMKEIFIKAATNQPVLGGEMEGYGLFKECRGFECSIPCLLVKSICDWGSYKNIKDSDIKIENLKDKLQAYAAEKAYQALLTIISRKHGIFEESLYDQLIREVLALRHETVISVDQMKDILISEIYTPKEFKHLEKTCLKIVELLLSEGILHKTKTEKVYQINNRR